MAIPTPTSAMLRMSVRRLRDGEGSSCILSLVPNSALFDIAMEACHLTKRVRCTLSKQFSELPLMPNRTFLDHNAPALVLAPMDGITDATMRAMLGSFGVFSWAVSEFIRVSNSPIPAHVFRREVPELGGNTTNEMPVQVQILGGDPGRMALSAHNAFKAGAKAIDINFGCPAPTVNLHDGGASILREPCRIREIVRAVRDSVPIRIPVSAKLRLGWDSIEDIDENAAMAAEGGASWLTIHARTRAQGYAPPVYWEPIGRVRKALALPIVANGDIWNLEDFKRCQEATGCIHFMIGRGALANPLLPYQIATELGIGSGGPTEVDWIALFERFVEFSNEHGSDMGSGMLGRLKQWTKIAHAFGDFPGFHELKRAENVEEFFGELNIAGNNQKIEIKACRTAAKSI